MQFSYKYLTQSDRVISIVLTIFSLVLFFSFGFSFVYYLKSSSELLFWLGVVLLIVFFGLIYIFNGNFVRGRSVYDHITISNDAIISLRYGKISLSNIEMIKINDLSKTFGFSLRLRGKKSLKFSCLSFFGSNGNYDFVEDGVAIKLIMEKILQRAETLDVNILVKKESSSGILFWLSCLAMLMLIPGLIYAPQRMIFVAPFVISIFFILWKKRYGK